MATAKVTDANFDEEVLNSSEPVVVDFWADWCPPCKQIAPALDEIAQEMSGKVKIAKFEVLEDSEIPIKYGIRNLPTLLLFKNGEVVSTQMGAKPKNAFVDWINETIA